MNKVLSGLVVFLVVSAASAQTSFYTAKSDTLRVTDTAWVVLDYGKTYLKTIEIVFDSATAGQILWITEGTDTAFAKRDRLPRQTKDASATIQSYKFTTPEDTLQFRVSTGEMLILVKKRTFY